MQDDRWLFYHDADDAWSVDENGSQYTPPQFLLDDSDGPPSSRLDRAFYTYFKFQSKVLMPPLPDAHTLIFIIECTRLYWNRRLRTILTKHLISPLASSGGDVIRQDNIVRTFLRTAADNGMSGIRFCYLLEKWLSVSTSFRGMDVQFWGEKLSSATEDVDITEAERVLHNASARHALTFLKESLGHLLKNIGFLALIAVPLVFFGIPYQWIQIAYAVAILPALAILGLGMCYSRGQWCGISTLIGFGLTECLLFSEPTFATVKAVMKSDLIQLLVSPFLVRDLAFFLCLVLLVAGAERLFRREVVKLFRLSYVHFALTVFLSTALPIGYFVLASFLATATGASLLVTALLFALLDLHCVLSQVPTETSAFARNLCSVRLLAWRRRAHYVGHVLIVTMAASMTILGYDHALFASSSLRVVFLRGVVAVSLLSLVERAVKPLLPLCRCLQILDANVHMCVSYKRRTSHTIKLLVARSIDTLRFPLVGTPTSLEVEGQTNGSTATLHKGI